MKGEASFFTLFCKKSCDSDGGNVKVKYPAFHQGYQCPGHGFLIKERMGPRPMDPVFR